MKSNFISLVCFLLLSTYSVFGFAQTPQVLPDPTANFLDELNPFDPNIAETLKQMDKSYERETGKPAFDLDLGFSTLFSAPTCFQLSCEVYVQVVKSEQRLYLYVRGVLQESWVVSTGGPGHETPLFNTQPNGRIYDAYSSSSYPGGSYNGLGNMPYAVFISGGFALHGTVKSNWSKLGQKASHGCIRMHPDNGLKVNRLIRAAGVKNTWISVQE